MLPRSGTYGIINPKLSIYTYPAEESEPKEFSKNLMKESSIPKTIIFKIMDVNKDREIKKKIPIPKKMISAFPEENFNYAYLINISNKTKLSKDTAKRIFKKIVKILKKLETNPKSFVIDAEPIIDPSDATFNTMDFHNCLIYLINTKLNLPVSMYFNPSILANPSLKVPEKEGFTKLMSTLRKYDNNNVHLAAYKEVRTDRILQSIKILEKVEVDYQIICRTGTI